MSSERRKNKASRLVISRQMKHVISQHNMYIHHTLGQLVKCKMGGVGWATLMLKVNNISLFLQ